jgi:hypothetical protein
VERLDSIRGLYVAVTGKCWIPRTLLVRKIRSLRGRPTPKLRVTTYTNVLVRGRSEAWAYHDYGRKEAEAERFIRQGNRILIVQDEDFRGLIEEGRPARCSETVRGVPIGWLVRPDERDFRQAARIEGPLDREYSAKGRAEQSYLRGLLFQDQEGSQCDLCGTELPTELLVAAHIKPRSECSREERLDAGNIVFALCQLGCDALYERGMVSVDAQGKVVTIESGSLRGKLREAIQSLKGRRCPAWRVETSEYFIWHFERRFLGCLL